MALRPPPSTKSLGAAPLFSRQATTWLMAATLVVLALLGAQRTFLLREELAIDRDRSASQNLATVVQFWEGTVEDKAQSWLDQIAAAEDVEATERSLRRSSSWFDAAYIWTRTDSGPRFAYPVASPMEEAEELRRDPCLARAFARLGMEPSLMTATRFRGCRTGPPAVRAMASSSAAAILLHSGRPLESLQVLDEVEPGIVFPLRDAGAIGVSANRLAIRRIQAARALEELGHTEERTALLIRTAREIVELHGAELEVLFGWGEQFIKDLHGIADDQEMNRLRAAMPKAHRRIRGWREVRDRLAKRAMAQTGESEEVRFTSDPLDLSGPVFAYTEVSDGRIAAVQLDPEALYRALLALMKEHGRGPELAILDAEGVPVVEREGEEEGEEKALLAEVPFRRIFPHLRVAMRGQPGGAMALGPGWLLSQLAPMSMVLVVGFVALLARARADRRQRDLYKRQQDFVARVTHELKTPLAGIRVMAETLEMGAVHDAATRDKFLGRIIQEAERLELRIDEVLRAAREPTAGVGRLVSPVDLLTGLVDRWAPRFEHMGATLEADLTPCPEIKVDEALLSDAISNLLDNALKYRREDRPGRCILRCWVERPWTCIEVTDNGIGVPQPMRRQIFQRFVRVEGSGRGKAGGHGLGLSFVAAAAAAHGGLCECREGLDGGARFLLKLRSLR